ncbi:MAG: SUMF1/EgtB/PvdO family nonheme iron enzyme, partial [Thermosynechococcaceae cyanobacterium]
HYSYTGAPSDGSAWLRENDNDYDFRLLRGGSWADSPRNCRSAFRDRDLPDSCVRFPGFRVACSAPRTL